MKNLLLTSAVCALMLPSIAQAATSCQTVPNCDGLGYKFTERQCRGFLSLKCPFDDTKYFCLEPHSPIQTETCTEEFMFFNEGTCKCSHARQDWVWLSKIGDNNRMANTTTFINYCLDDLESMVGGGSTLREKIQYVCTSNNYVGAMSVKQIEKVLDKLQVMFTPYSVLYGIDGAYNYSDGQQMTIDMNSSVSSKGTYPHGDPSEIVTNPLSICKEPITVACYAQKSCAEKETGGSEPSANN